MRDLRRTFLVFFLRYQICPGFKGINVSICQPVKSNYSHRFCSCGMSISKPSSLYPRPPCSDMMEHLNGEDFLIQPPPMYQVHPFFERLRNASACNLSIPTRPNAVCTGREKTLLQGKRLHFPGHQEPSCRRRSCPPGSMDFFSPSVCIRGLLESTFEILAYRCFSVVCKSSLKV